MKSLSKFQLVIILILALLTALEPLSIDLYLPSFINMGEHFNTSLSNVQISLTTFLAGFAVGQLFWGPMADRFGRKKPILLSLVIFTVASILCIWVSKIEYLWILRFFQAIGGCAGVVISRAIVSDVFDKSKSLQVYGVLMIIMGVAPILGPIIGNLIQDYYTWKGVFILMTILGLFSFIITLLFLPETIKQKSSSQKMNVLNTYLEIFKTNKFWEYTLILGITNSVFMLFLANAPHIIIEKAGFTSSQFSIIFAINAIGLMISSNIPMVIEKWIPIHRIVNYSVIAIIVLSALLTIGFIYQINFYWILTILFFIVFILGFFYTIFTNFSMQLFEEKNAASASSLLGSIMVGIPFIITLITGFIPTENLYTVGLLLLIVNSLFIWPLLSLKKKNLQA